MKSVVVNSAVVKAVSPSLRRVWVEMSILIISKMGNAVTLLAEGVG